MSRDVSPLDERRQRAREAFYDAMGPGQVISSSALESAIETATRVRITDEADRAFLTTYHEATPYLLLDEARKRGLAAALRELGFEVGE